MDERQALDEITNFLPRDIHVKMRKHGLFLLKSTEMHFNATFTHLSTAVKGVSSSSEDFGGTNQMPGF